MIVRQNEITLDGSKILWKKVNPNKVLLLATRKGGYTTVYIYINTLLFFQKWKVLVLHAFNICYILRIAIGS
jgi:hypothetical protein